MKRDGLARVSKIDVGALLDKNKSLAERAIFFPRSTSAAIIGRSSPSGFFEVKKKLRDYFKSEWHKFLYLDEPKVKVKSLGNHARRQPRATNSGSDRRAAAVRSHRMTAL
jgi:hypothetical protein